MVLLSGRNRILVRHVEALLHGFAHCTADILQPNRGTNFPPLSGEEQGGVAT